MNEQMALDWSRAQGELGMRRAASRAERVAGPKFSERVADYFLAVLTTRGPQTGEDLTDAARAAGFMPEDDRAFGQAFKRILQHGAEVVPGAIVPRRKGHGAIGGKLYRMRTT